MQEERIVIVAYKPHKGQEAKLKELLDIHVPLLRTEGLATDRAPILTTAKDGTIIEIFGWKSKQAIEQAHFNPAVQKLWEDFAEICQYIPISELEEAQQLFSEFGAA